MSVEELKEKLGQVKIEKEQLEKQLLHINFIDEDGEVLLIRTKPGVRTSNVFDKYARQQGTPFLLSRVMYEFRYNGKIISLNVAIGERIVASEGNNSNNAIIYVTTRLPSKSDFDNREIVPQIPVFVKDHPWFFINNLASWGDQPIVIKNYLDGEPGTFIIEYTNSSETLELDAYEFIRFLQNYYSDLNGFYQDINIYLGQLVSNYESQVEQLDTDQSLDTPNAIILRMIKIRQQIHRLLSLINSVTDKDERGLSKLDSFSGRLRKALSSLTDEMKRHVSNKSLNKVKKPLLDSGDVVRVKQWPNNDKELEPYWENGIVRSYTEHEDIDGYGPRRVYSVEFDNGECRSDVEDYHVIPGKEFKFTIKKGEGVKNILDEDSSDPWAREIGWYTVDIKGTKETFVHLSHALRAVMSGATMFFHRPQHLSIREDYQQSVLYLKIGVLQLMDRISDPIMRRIGDILLQPAEYKLYEVEQEGLIWNAALEVYNDKQTNQMRDVMYKLALLKQCKIFGSDESVNIDQVCRFFIGSEGCLDTFLLKVPIFREGYDTIIPSESDHEKNFNLRYLRAFAYLTNNRPDDADAFMSIKFVDGSKSKRYTVACNAPLKELLTKYADDRGTSIKSLRIKHNERTLFISSIGKKTPIDLGIEEYDVIEVTILQITTTETTTNEQRKQPSSKGKNKKRNNKKKHKKSNKRRPVQVAPPEDLKGEHSKLLGKVYEEAEPTFKEIRQRLNALNLERTKPKQRTSPSKATKPVEVVDNPLGDGQLGGKAGKTQFIIQVGEVSNLYKTTKPSSRGRREDDIMIDLHGLTAEEAVYRLDKSLPTWIETAMKGTYPFVIPVKIVCGGGSQILAEVVENWIKQNDNVANAPKNMY